MQCTYNVTLWRISLAILQRKQPCILCLLFIYMSRNNHAFCVCSSATCHCRLSKNVHCCTTVLLWQICHTQRCKFYIPIFERNYILTNFYSFTPINAVLKKKNVHLLIVFFQAYSLAKQVVMTCESSRSFSVFVSVAVTHFSRSDGINQL